MANNGKTYSRVFNQMCHLVALKKDGKLQAAIDSLILTTLVLDRKLNPQSADDIAESIATQFERSITLTDRDIRSSIDRHLNRGNLIQDGERLSIDPKVRVEVEERIDNVRNLEATVQSNWLTSLVSLFDSVEGDWQSEIWNCLRIYMAKAFHQHGARTIQLLQPDVALSSDDTKTLDAYLDDAYAETCKCFPIELARESIQKFFHDSDSKRTRYVVQLLDGTFTFFALNVDEEIASYLLDNVPNVSILMDSNFLFGLLGLHNNRLNDVSDELVEIIKVHKFPFKLYYHAKTLEEMQRTLTYYGDKIRGRNWRPDISRRALLLPQLSGVERKYHERNSKSPVSPDIFLSQYEHLSNLLDSEYEFAIYRPSHIKIDDQQRYNLMQDYEDYLKGWRDKSYEVKEHDILLWQTVRAMRKPGQTGLEAGAFFLTVDYVFYTFDRDRLRNNSEISTTILPNQLLQLLRPFISLSEDVERRFVETFAIPEFRAVNVDYRDTYSKVLSYMNSYLDISEKTALKILTNEMAMQQFADLDEDTEEFKRVFESLLAEQNVALADEIQNLENEYSQKLEALQHLQDNVSTKDSRIRTIEADLQNLREQIDQLVNSKAQQEKAHEERIAKAHEDAETKLNEERERAKRRDLERDAEQKRTQDEFNAQIERERTKFRALIAGILSIVSIGFIWLVLPRIQWDWLENHPNKLGLYLAASAIILGTAWATVDKNRRNFALGTLVVGTVLVIIQIIGR